MHLCVSFGCLAIHVCPVLCVHGSHPDSPPRAPQKDGGEGVLEGLSEVVAHEGVNQRVDRGVGVRHAVTPDLQLWMQNEDRLLMKGIDLCHSKSINFSTTVLSFIFIISVTLDFT